MNPVFGFDNSVAEWVSKRIPEPGRFGNCRAMAVLSESGDIKAGVVFFNWDTHKSTLELACASIDRRWMTRRVMGAVWGFTFGFVRLAYARTSALNTPVRKIWRACGSHEYIIPDMYGEGEAMALLTLTEPQWLQSRFANGQGLQRSAAA